MMPYKAVVGKRQFYRRLKKRREIICKDLNSEKLLTKVNYENANVKNDTDNLNTDVSVGCETSHNSLGTPNILNSNDCLLNETLQLNTLVPCKHDTTVFEFVPENSQYSNKLGICQELRNWVIRSGSLPHNSVTYLLHVLSKYHPELPLDCRTLLKTPTKTLMRPLNKGNYCHLGISTALENFLLRNPKFTESVIEVAFNIDGLPLYKSCNSQLWPILGQIKNFNSKPFSIGIFYGSSKPQPLNLFLDDFISELKHLIDNTFCFKGKLYEIKVFAFICDAPARSFLKCIKSHNGYSSCEKCIEVGDYIDGRIVLKSVTSQKRTDDSFLRQTDDDHHTGISPLVKLSIGLVSKFPIDYMHTVCLGVVRKLLHTWTSGPLKVRLCSSKVQKISETLEHFCKSIPIEFNRKSRSLSELARWKATEFRTFLLYLGPVVLKGTIPVAIYEHFLLLHCAISILISKQRLSDIGVNYADTLLKTFLCQIWIDQIKNQQFSGKTLTEIRQSYRVCDLHFSEASKIPDGKGRRGSNIKFGSIPSLHFSSTTAEPTTSATEMIVDEEEPLLCQTPVSGVVFTPCHTPKSRKDLHSRISLLRCIGSKKLDLTPRSKKTI
ncbi:uncharacterized protein [Diabrotica undecimpunctata]|uniref:uncharacterized protein n=1 Tax=Diabrotica undecimpunctata TaxID=50387 RepID=UPI003B63676D